MCAQLTQDDRLGKITTALGKDKLLLLRFNGTDHVNDLFCYNVEAISKDDEVSFDDLVGTPLSVSLSTQHHGDRVFSGVVSRVKRLSFGDGGDRYDIELRPWFWLADKRRNNRIWHGRTVLEIVQEVLSSYSHHGKPAFQDDCKGSYQPIEYTMQHGESDMKFVRRMLERFGISFYFSHDVQSHTMHIFDNGDDLPDVSGGTRPFIARESIHIADEERFFTWHPESNITTGAIRMMDYYYRTADAAMEVDHVGNAAFPNGQIESFDFPGGYNSKTEGTELARLRTSQARFGDRKVKAEGDVMSLTAGMKMELGGGDSGSASGKYFCVSASHSYTSDSYASGGTDAGAEAYKGSYEFIPGNCPVVPEMKTESDGYKYSTTIGVCVDNKDPERLDRIKISLPMILGPETTTWARVIQTWAGPGFGAVVVPRIGMEVVVEFLHNDPNHPIVIGCVYHSSNTPPYEMGQDPGKTTFMTQTLDGTGFNELRFDDVNGKEEVFVHASRDMNTKVERNRTERVNENSVESVGQNKGIEIGSNLSEIIVGDYEMKIGPAGAGTHTPGNATDETQGIASAAESLQAGPGDGSFKVTVEGAERREVKKTFTEKVTEDYSVQVLADYLLDGKKNITIQAGDSITLKAGSASIVLKKDGSITIQGSKLNAKTSGDIVMKGAKIAQN